MTVYNYKGVNSSGKAVRSTFDADSQRALKDALRRKGIYVTEIWEGEKKAGNIGQVEINFGKLLTDRVGLKDIAILTRMLATLLKAGIPLVEALNALVDQVDKESLQAALDDIRRKVNEGTSFAQALSDHPKMFDDLYINMVRAGESSGNLDVVLSRLTEFLDAQVELRGKVTGAMVYPIIMGLLGTGIVAFLFTFVIPKVTLLFQDQDKALPLITEIMIGISSLFAGYWWLMLILLALVVFGFQRWRASEKGRAIWDDFVLKVPLFGGLIRMVAIARFSKTLSTLLASGVPLLTAMDIVKEILGNKTLIRVIEEARLNIREGESIAGPLRRSGQFPPIVTHMISIGEKAG
ncbi:MAG: type II secretion system F family protein, partial [Myxococcota bacterium]